MNVRLANLLDDAVTGSDNGIAAATDGMWCTSTKRNQYLNEAMRYVVLYLFNQAETNEDIGEALAAGSKKTQAITFSGSGVALNADYLYHAALIDSNKQEYKFVRIKSNLDQDLDPYLDAAYTIEGSTTTTAPKLYAYLRVAGVMTLQSSGTATLYYLFADRLDSNGVDIAVNTTPDAVIDLRYFDAIVLYAAGRAAFDKSIIDSDPTWADKGNRYMAQASTLLPK